MAFNIQTFKTRALTAIVFVIVMLLGLFWNIWSFVFLFTIIHFGCWYEFIKLLKKIYPKRFGYYLPLGLIYITTPVMMMIYWRTGKFNQLNDSAFSFLDVIFPAVIIFSIWINDTMAYIVGSFIGKTSLSKISPKKTWEGTIGGAILCVVVMYLVVLKEFKDWRWIIIPAICAIFATIGDLLESKLKRLANVKDSGTIMPGHGGFLDRFDSLLIATPVVWLYVYFFM